MPESEVKRPKRTKKAKPKPEETTVKIPDELPLLPIRDAVYFPHMIFPLFAGRDKSVRALDEAMAQDRMILLVAQKEIGTDDPNPEDIYRVGLVASIMQITKVPDGTVRLVLEGVERARITKFVQEDPHFRVRIQTVPTLEESSIELEALMRSATTQFEQIVNIGRSIPPEALINIMNITEPGRLADTITPYLPLRVESKQDIIETISVRERLEKLNVLLKKELEILEIQRNIRNRVEKEMGDTQREFILREQMKAI
ncbi:MAG TPA: LON peptidase substrate-binding domain-containing protein, partial [Armatimonadota bacterium]